MNSISASELIPDYYEMRVYFLGENEKILDEKKVTFAISPVGTIGHPIANLKSFPLSNKFLFYLMLADQYAKVNANEKALVNYKKAYRLNPNYKKGIIRYGHFLVKMKKFNKALEIVENLREDENFRFDYYLLKGLALAGKGNYVEAINNLLEGNKIYNSDIRLLNILGFCYFKIGRNNEALNALKASLNLNPQQKDIKKLVTEIEKNQSK
jgi:tetratricopeptide (TPR) repeat protein